MDGRARTVAMASRCLLVAPEHAAVDHSLPLAASCARPRC
jgi:hypothetical protein